MHRHRGAGDGDVGRIKPHGQDRGSQRVHEVAVRDDVDHATERTSRPAIAAFTEQLAEVSDTWDSPGHLDSVPALEAAIHKYLAHYNEHCTPFVWTATADVILDKVSRFCQRTSWARH